MARVLFLGGLGRSGTTLVERLLGELPGGVRAGRGRPPLAARHPRRRALRLRRPVLRLRRSGSAVGEHGLRRLARVDVDRVLALRDAVERTRHIPRLAAARLPAPHRAGRASTPATTRRLPRRPPRSPAPASSSTRPSTARSRTACAGPDDVDLRVVHVVRDARGVAYSWTKTVARPETDGTDEMTRYSPGRSALLWNAHNAAFGLLARRGVPVRRVRYEEFLADPRTALRELAAFAGLTVARRDLDFLGDGARRPARRAQRGGQPDAVHRRPAAAAPRRRLASRAAQRPAPAGRRGLRAAAARVRLPAQPRPELHRRRPMNLAVRRRRHPHPQPPRAGPQGDRRGPRAGLSRARCRSSWSTTRPSRTTCWPPPSGDRRCWC